MKNRFIIKKIITKKNIVKYDYSVEGEWIELFNFNNMFFVEYDRDISNVPDSILIIPLLSNILPISWICNGEIVCDTIDESFYNNIINIKKGYIEMYPQLSFDGKISYNQIVKNENSKKKSYVFFSGGVDAYNTLIKHIDESPKLISVLGSDIRLDDTNGWNNVYNELLFTKKEFNLELSIIKSNFRIFVNNDNLNEVVKLGNDSWWHGFQHGIGIISLSFPLAFIDNVNNIYFASSFTSRERGMVTCASDPTIDNYMTASSFKTIHDGYEYTRQDKVHNIIEFTKKSDLNINLRVCWQENEGKNCCECEKCWRTILEIIAENEDPKKYGLEYSRHQLKQIKKILKNPNMYPYYAINFYKDTQIVMKKNVNYKKLSNEIKWFYNLNLDKMKKYRMYNFLKKVYRKIRK